MRTGHRDTAYHEAGHVVGWWLRGVPVHYVTAGEATGGALGSTSPAVTADTLDALLADGDERWLGALMGDAVDYRRGVRNTGMHVLEAADDVGEERARELLADAKRLVEEYWEPVEQVALAIMDAPGLTLHAEQLARLRTTTLTT